MLKTKWLVILVLAAVTVAMCPAGVQAAFLGQLTTARVLERGVQDISGFVGFFEHATLFLGQARRGLSSGIDGGLQFGLIDPEGGDVGLEIGGDLKFALIDAHPGDPFDLAVHARTAFFNYEKVSVFQLGGSLVMSHSYPLSSGSSLEPYGAVNLRLERISVDSDNSAKDVDYDDTSLEIGAVGGLKWDVSDLIDILGEFVLDDDIGFIFGVNFKI